MEGIIAWFSAEENPPHSPRALTLQDLGCERGLKSPVPSLQLKPLKLCILDWLLTLQRWVCCIFVLPPSPVVLVRSSVLSAIVNLNFSECGLWRESH